MNISRTQAVKMRCTECSGDDNGNRSVTLCTVAHCYLFPFRSGTPKKENIEKHRQARANVDERNRLMSLNNKGVVNDS